MIYDFSDQTKIFNPDSWSWPVHLIGAGGINNLVGPILIKQGIKNLHIWDDDILEDRNCPTEIGYSYRMSGQPKIRAMLDTLRYLMGAEDLDICAASNVQGGEWMSYYVGNTYSPATIRLHPHRAEVTTRLDGVVVCGVDSMHSRREIWQSVKTNFLDIPLYIDARSAGEVYDIFAFSPANFDDVECYEQNWLFDDSEALPLACGARNIGYLSAIIAGEICRLITRFHRNLPIEFYKHHDLSVE